jgi:hypothetical protein
MSTVTRHIQPYLSPYYLMQRVETYFGLVCDHAYDTMKTHLNNGYYCSGAGQVIGQNLRLSAFTCG